MQKNIGFVWFFVRLVTTLRRNEGNLWHDTWSVITWRPDQTVAVLDTTELTDFQDDLTYKKTMGKK